MERTRHSVVALVIGVVLVLGACGGSSPNETQLSTGASSDDRAAAGRMLLTAGDLSGFEAATVPAPDVSTVDQQAASSFEACAGAVAALDDDSIAQSPAFFRDRTAMVSSLAVVAPTQAAATQAMADLGRADLGGCLTALFRSVLGLDLLPGTTATTDLLPASAVKSADSTTTWRTSLHVAISGQSVPAYADLTFLRSGRAVGVVFAFEVGKPFAVEERTKLAEKVAERLEKI